MRSAEETPAMSEAEHDIWAAMRRIHCSHPKKKAGAHACLGTISFTPDGMTLDCTLCGFSQKQPREAQT